MVDAQGRVTMGPATWQAHVSAAGGASRDIVAVNEWSPSVDLALVTPELGTVGAAGATEMVLTPAGPSGQYRVRRIDAGLSVFDVLAPGEIGVVARGAQALALMRDFHPGDVLTLSEQSDPPVQGMRVGVGGGPLLVSGGRAVSDPTAPAPEETDVRNPVTGAGLSSDGTTLWLVVVDGRRPSISIGLTRPQFAALFIALGATTAMAFDSGGSSEMVVRHAGDLTSSLATSPSDGRERSIADGLFVLNTAARGRVATLILKAAAASVLVGSTLDVQARAVDAGGQPVPLKAADLAFSADPATVATVDAMGTISARSPGVVQVNAAVGSVRTSAIIRVVGSVDDLRVIPADPIVPVGGKVLLSISAASKDGAPIAVDAAAVRWTQSTAGGRIGPDGTFMAGPTPAKTTVTALAGGAAASVTVLSGDHAIMLQAVPRAGASGDAWHYVARPAGLPGAVDGAASPDGSQALRLAYDFSNSQATRAAYAQTELTLPGQPIAFAVDVYGDRNLEWLRAGYRNADGNDESLTLARHVDWQGWKTIRVAVPPQSAWPIEWTRLYVVERSNDMREQGSLWFRNLELFFAGPP